MDKKHLVAGTVMAQAYNGKYVFLVKSIEDSYELPMAPISDNKTGMACIIDELKTILNIDGSTIDLYELANSVVKGSRVPLFVFTLNKQFTELNELFKNEHAGSYCWMPSEALTKALENMDISGVPIFNP